MPGKNQIDVNFDSYKGWPIRDYLCRTNEEWHMRKGKYVFSPFLDFLDCYGFNYLAKIYDGDKYVKRFTCWNQLSVLMFW